MEIDCLVSILFAALHSQDEQRTMNIQNGTEIMLSFWRANIALSSASCD